MQFSKFGFKGLSTHAPDALSLWLLHSVLPLTGGVCAFCFRAPPMEDATRPGFVRSAVTRLESGPAGWALRVLEEAGIATPENAREKGSAAARQAAREAAAERRRLIIALREAEAAASAVRTARELVRRFPTRSRVPLTLTPLPDSGGCSR